ncbi:hypothetical protein [Moraxella bovis]|uniref:hypothetical protein n=1 Tax=Moraxella bovis TaxID=476 RepID=UPI000E1C08E5|nr:hypothetical protein [Moraxella bovis]UYZ73063.1 hypothetical protein LP105_12065 [Moraxella bovis]UZA42947.1 hypothetical protein LP090_12460 [Moraxella bovis]
MHIWFEGVLAEENIHNHRWDYASHILLGELNSETWQESFPHHDNAQPLDCYLYTAKSQNKPAQTAYLGKKYLTKTKTHHHVCGDTYHLSSNTLHKIIAGQKSMTATIICTTPTTNLQNLLFPTSNNPNINPTYITTNQLKEHLNTFITHTQSMEKS